MGWPKATGALLALVLLFTSCIKVDGKIKIEDDGSGNVDFLTALNTEALTGVLGDFDIPETELGSQDELCDGFESEMSTADDAPPGATVTPYEEDGFCGARIEYALAASTDHSAQISDLFEDDARLYKEGDNWFFDTGFSADEITAEADDAPQAMIDALFGESSFVITVDLPGRAIDGENNATSVGSDGVFTWDIDVLNPPARLFAQTEPGSGGGTGGGGGGFNPLLIVGLVALLAALGAAVYWFLNRDNSSDAAMPDAGPAQAGTAPGPSYATTPGAASMPLADTAPISASPVTPQAASVQSADAAPQTVIMSSQDLIDAAADPAAAAAAGATAATASTPPTNEPVWDEARGAWVIQDPARGLLRHDPATDTWNPA